MDFNQLNYLVTLAELKSFSKAAERLFISQPALTRCVKNIEREVGIPLFDRSRSPIRLTYAGERYLAGMQQILHMKLQLDQEMADIVSREKDRLIIGIPSTRSATWMPRIFPAFRRSHPNVEIQLVEGNSILMEKKLEREEIDLYLMGTTPILSDSVEMVPFFQEEMLLVVSRNASIFCGMELPQNQRGVLQYISPQLLNKIPFFSATPSQGTYYFSHTIFDRHEIHPETVMEVINTSVAYQLAPGGGGFAFGPTTISYEESFSPDPLFCTIADPPLYRMVGILYKKNRLLSKAAKAFIAVAGEQVRSHAEKHIPPFSVRYDLCL